MQRRGIITGRIAGWLARLGLLAVLAASLIAPGVMPTRDAGGAVTMVICTAQGAVEMAVPGGDAPQAPRDDRMPCAFAMAQVAVALLAQPAVALPPQTRRSLPRAPRAASLALPDRNPSPFAARAPPALI